MPQKEIASIKIILVIFLIISIELVAVLFIRWWKGSYDCSPITGRCSQGPFGEFSSFSTCQDECGGPLPPSDIFSCDYKTGKCYGDPKGQYHTFVSCKENCKIEESDCLDICKTRNYVNGICRSWPISELTFEYGCYDNELNIDRTSDCQELQELSGVSVACCCSTNSPAKLMVYCSGHVTNRVEGNEEITFKAWPSGGSGIYSVTWFGSIKGSGLINTVKISHLVDERVYVKVVDSLGAIATSSCPIWGS